MHQSYRKETYAAILKSVYSCCVLHFYPHCSFIDEAAGDVGVAIDAAVAQERPPTTHLLAVMHVDTDDNALFLVVARTVKEFALWPGYETTAPKLDTLGLSAWVRFVTNAVHGNDG